MFFKYLKFALWSGLFGIGAIGVASAGLYYQALGDLPDVEKLKEVSRILVIVVMEN